MYFHLECKQCNKYGFYYAAVNPEYNEVVCVRCSFKNDFKKPKVLFVTFSIGDCLKSIFSKTEENDVIFDVSPPNQYPISDFRNGDLYRNLVEKIGGAFIDLSIFSDGVKRHDSSKNDLWPLYASCMNLKPEYRYSQQKTSIIALYNGRNIEFKYFMEFFVKELEQINTQGGFLVYGRYLSVYCLSAVLDSQARPKLQGHTLFSGYCGCSYCHTTGGVVDGTMKYSCR